MFLLLDRPLLPSPSSPPTPHTFYIIYHRLISLENCFSLFFRLPSFLVTPPSAFTILLKQNMELIQSKICQEVTYRSKLGGWKKNICVQKIFTIYLCYVYTGCFKKLHCQYTGFLVFSYKYILKALIIFHFKFEIK